MKQAVAPNIESILNKLLQNNNNIKNSCHFMEFGILIFKVDFNAKQRCFYQSRFQQFSDGKQRWFSVASRQLHALVGQVAQSLDQVLDRRVTQAARRFKQSGKMKSFLVYRLLTFLLLSICRSKTIILRKKINFIKCFIVRVKGIFYFYFFP
jgi:hypothetical protein